MSARLRNVLGLALLACGAYVAAAGYLLSGDFGLPLDDSWIHLQFARNLAAGSGLSYDGATLVTGSTAPLWTALLALVHLLPGPILLWIGLVGVSLHLIGVHATYRLARELEVGRDFALLAALLTALTGWLVWSALSGMEVPLFIALSLWGMVLHCRELKDRARPAASWVVLGLAALARPEGLLLLVLAGADEILRWWLPDAERSGENGDWRTVGGRLLRGAGLALLVVAPVMIFHQLVGGSVFPTTLAAKTGGVMRWLPSARYLYAVIGIFFPAQPVMTLLAGAGVLALVRRATSKAGPGLLPALWLVALPLAYSTLSPPAGGLLAGNFGRYFFPLLPVVVVLGMLGAQGVLRVSGEFAGQIEGRSWRTFGAALLLAPTLWTLTGGAGQYAQTVANVQDSDVAMARWLESRLPPEAVLAVNDVGAMGYLLPNRLLDLAGLVTPEVNDFVDAAVAQGAPWESGVAAFLERERPDYLVIFPSWFPRLTGPASPYRPLLRLEIPDNITMGGDEIVLYSTPWTRHPLVASDLPSGAASLDSPHRNEPSEDG